MLLSRVKKKTFSELEARRKEGAVPPRRPSSPPPGVALGYSIALVARSHKPCRPPARKNSRPPVDSNMPSPSTSPQPNPARENRYKQLFRKYGKVALGVHLGVYACFFAGEAAGQPGSPQSSCAAAAPKALPLCTSAGCYLAVDNSVDVRGMLSKYGLMSGLIAAGPRPALETWQQEQQQQQQQQQPPQQPT